MKKASKYLSIIFIIALMLNAVSIGAFAAVPENSAVVLKVAPTEASYAPGSVVKFEVYAETIEAVKDVNGGELDFFYDNTVFELMTENSGTHFTNDNFVVNGCSVEGTKLEGMVDLTNSYVHFSKTMGSFTPENAHGWNTGYHIVILPGSGAHDFHTDPGVLFTFQLKIKDDAVSGEHFVGMDRDSAENAYTYLIDSNMGCYEGDYETYGLDGSTDMYIFQNTPVVVGSTVTDPAVSNDGVKVQWDNDASHIKLGYKATISDLALTTTFNSATNAYEVNELSEVGVIFSTTITDPTLADVDGGTALKAICNTLYDNGDDTYSFRAVVKGAPIDSTTTIYSVMYITLTDGTTSYYSISGATTPKAAFDAGRANGMPDFGA